MYDIEVTNLHCSGMSTITLDVTGDLSTSTTCTGNIYTTNLHASGISTITFNASNISTSNLSFNGSLNSSPGCSGNLYLNNIQASDVISANELDCTTLNLTNLTASEINTTTINSQIINNSNLTTSNLNTFTANVTNIFNADTISIGTSHTTCVSLSYQQLNPDACGLLIGFSNSRWSGGSGDYAIGYSMYETGYCLKRNNESFWDQISDERLKTNINTLSNGLYIINQLRPVNYNWKDATLINGDSNIQQGFIAQEFQQVLPNLVKSTPIINDNMKQLVGDSNILTLNQDIIPLLVSSIQELTKRIEELELNVNK